MNREQAKKQMLARRKKIHTCARAGMTPTATAKHLRVCIATVSDHWPSDMKFRKYGDPVPQRTIQRMYQKGISPRAISEQLGVSIQSVYRYTAKRAFQKLGLVRIDQQNNTTKKESDHDQPC